MRRTDAAYGLAILLREIAEKVTIYTFSRCCEAVPSRRGMALRDALDQSQPHGGTYLGAALKQVEGECARAMTGWWSSPTSSRTTRFPRPAARAT